MRENLMDEFTQAEADLLIAMSKHRIDETIWEFPRPGSSIAIPLVSEDKKENFLLDIHKGRIDLKKGKYQNRARKTTILVRLDFGGSPHRNPDGQEIPSPHLHLYREGFGDKWAMSVPANEFRGFSDLAITLEDFMKYCQIIEPPNFQMNAFL
jgi:hypothetical protein